MKVVAFLAKRFKEILECYENLCGVSARRVEDSVASRKNQLSDEFFKIGFMLYFLSLNSPLSRYRDRNSKSALAFLNQHMEKR